MLMPIIMPVNNYTHTSDDHHYVKSYDGPYINISYGTQCGVYQSQGKWWIWFNIQGKCKYLLQSFDTKKEAEDDLLRIIDR